MKKRSHATLIEVLIALSLTALLLGALFSFPLLTSRRSRAAEKILLQVQQEASVMQRLKEVLSEATLSSDGFFFTSNDGLVFCYNNGIDRDPRFSAEVLGKLYVDTDRLILATWPHPRRWKLDPYPHRQELLMTRVSSLQLEFFEPHPLPDKAVCAEEISEGRSEEPIPPGWQSVWKATYKELPALVRLSLTRPEESPIRLECSLPEADKSPLLHYYKRASQ